MNGTLNSFPLSDEASSVDTPDGSRDMMDIRYIIDTNANSDNEEDFDSTINIGNPLPHHSNLDNQQSNVSNLVSHLTNGFNLVTHLSYGSYSTHHSINDSAYNAEGNSSNDGDNDSSNNNTEETQQENSLESIGLSSQEIEQLLLQEQQQQETEPEPVQLEQLAELQGQQERQEESSEDTEPEQQPEPTPVEEDLSIRFRHLPNATHVDQTPFAHKIDLIADYQDSTVIMSSDETYGAASNLIKTVATPLRTHFQSNEEDEFRDGWLVKRHEESGYATIRLGVPGTITGIDIDCTGYTQCAPLFASVHGNLRSRITNWTALAERVPLIPNAHNFFEVINNTEVHTHAHFTVTPGGGVARLRCYGDIHQPTSMNSREVNMASSKAGAEIVQKPANIVRGEFPNLIIERKASSQDGWICPRVRNGQAEESEFTVIKLAGEAKIDRIVVDTVHFIGNAPEKVVIEGCCIAASQNGGNVDPGPFASAEWINLIAENGVLPNSYNSLPCIYYGPITHIRYRPVPNGGVSQILVKGSYFSARVALPQPQHMSNLVPLKKRRNDENDSRRKSSRVKRPVSRYQ
ncbi:allantoicase [Mucor ambiguus]|uniref:Allantoicase n=1 Tax=Mucor ambiguus TaxID=91626 RepID=A0A0C9LT48_9FUNG|nr:allantoicase [Mucor ambiguus]